MTPEEILLRDQREICYYGFSVSELIDDFGELVRSEITKTVRAFKENLTTSGSESINKNKEEMIREEYDELQSCLLAKSSEVLEKFETTARSIFAIPPNVKVFDSDDEEVERIVSDEELQKLEKEVCNLEQEFLEEKYFVELLKTERAKFDIIKPVQDLVATVLENLRQHNTESGKCLKDLYEVFKKVDEFRNSSGKNVESEDNLKELLAMFEDGK